MSFQVSMSAIARPWHKQIDWFGLVWNAPSWLSLFVFVEWLLLPKEKKNGRIGAKRLTDKNAFLSEDLSLILDLHGLLTTT